MDLTLSVRLDYPFLTNIIYWNVYTYVIYTCHVDYTHLLFSLATEDKEIYIAIRCCQLVQSGLSWENLLLYLFIQKTLSL